MNRLGPWWASRTEREQRMLAGLGVVLALVLIWFGAVAPLLDWRTAATGRYERAAGDHAVVAAGLAQLGGGTDGPAMAPALLEQRVRETAQARGLALAGASAQGDRLTVTLDGAPPGLLFSWLAALEREHGVVVRSFSAHRVEGGGLQVQAALGGPAR